MYVSYTYVCTTNAVEHTYTYIYIYIYTERERERETHTNTNITNTNDPAVHSVRIIARVMDGTEPFQ